MFVHWTTLARVVEELRAEWFGAQHVAWGTACCALSGAIAAAGTPRGAHPLSPGRTARSAPQCALSGSGGGVSPTAGVGRARGHSMGADAVGCNAPGAARASWGADCGAPYRCRNAVVAAVWNRPEQRCSHRCRGQGPCRCRGSVAGRGALHPAAASAPGVGGVPPGDPVRGCPCPKCGSTGEALRPRAVPTVWD
jgi:hypothetical protein